MNKLLCILILLFFSKMLYGSEQLEEKIEITKRDYLQLVIGSYIWGFNQFDNELLVYPELIRVNIYVTSDKQLQKNAITLKKRFETQIPLKLKTIDWAKNFKVEVNIYDEQKNH